MQTCWNCALPGSGGSLPSPARSKRWNRVPAGPQLDELDDARQPAGGQLGELVEVPVFLAAEELLVPGDAVGEIGGLDPQVVERGRAERGKAGRLEGRHGVLGHVAILSSGAGKAFPDGASESGLDRSSGAAAKQPPDLLRHYSGCLQEINLTRKIIHYPYSRAPSSSNIGRHERRPVDENRHLHLEPDGGARRRPGPRGQGQCRGRAAGDRGGTQPGQVPPPARPHPRRAPHPRDRRVRRLQRDLAGPGAAAWAAR